MIILGIGGILGDAASAILKDGELVAAVEESEAGAPAHPLGRAGELPEHSIATCLELAGARRRSRWMRWPSCGPFPNPDFHLKLRAQFPAQPHRGGGASPGARRVGLLSFAVRRGHRADARPRRRFPLRLALAGRAARSMTLEQEQYFAGFAGRPLRPRHRTAGLRRQRGRAQGAVALGRAATTATATCSSKS